MPENRRPGCQPYADDCHGKAHLRTCQEPLTPVYAEPLDKTVRGSYGAVMRDAALLRAIEAAGGTAALAKALNLSSQAISQWARVPAERVLEVERATAGAVSRYELRPDVYGGQPEEATA